jgi:hypothetical protein
MRDGSSSKLSRERSEIRRRYLFCATVSYRVSSVPLGCHAASGVEHSDPNERLCEDRHTALVACLTARVDITAESSVVVERVRSESEIQRVIVRDCRIEAQGVKLW